MFLSLLSFFVSLVQSSDSTITVCGLCVMVGILGYCVGHNTCCWFAILHYYSQSIKTSFVWTDTFCPKQLHSSVVSFQLIRSTHEVHYVITLMCVYLWTCTSSCVCVWVLFVYKLGCYVLIRDVSLAWPWTWYVLNDSMKVLGLNHDHKPEILGLGTKGQLLALGLPWHLDNYNLVFQHYVARCYLNILHKTV